MSLSAQLHRAIEDTLETRIVTLRPLSGGDINDAFSLELSDGRNVFLKTHVAAPTDMFWAEAKGLAWLSEAGALRVPEVIAVSDPGIKGPPYLILEMLTPGDRVGDFDDRLGRGLAALHQTGSKHFGWSSDNYIGALPQGNSACDDWVEFYREARLRPMIAMARQRGHGDAALERRFDRLFEYLSEHVGSPEPPARLHGDLWGGNLHVAPNGEPALIDPAVYGGHREVDLAMMKLFGGFSQRVFDAYHEAYPLQPGFEERVPLYQLYPLLVHLVLFGTGYRHQVDAALSRLGS
ncbi:MAG: fructosamine kinase family protein [Myxococcota bacterium]